MSADQVRALLLAVLALPMIGALLLIPARKTSLARQIALGVALLHLALTGLLVVQAGTRLAQRDADLQQVFRPEFVPGAVANPDGRVIQPQQTSWNLISLSSSPGGDNLPNTLRMQFYLGIDGFNLGLIGLTSLMMVPVLLLSWNTITDRANCFYAWLFVLQTATLGVFMSFDIMLFYVFFELTLIPLFFLIGIWGVGPSKRDAARKFFLYTLTGSLLTLVGVLGLVLTVYANTQVLTFAIPELASQLRQLYQSPDQTQQAYWQSVQFYCFLAMIAGFIVKIPLVPFHSWLPGAYAESPSGVTVLLSALLAKMGTFGLVRLCLPLLPDATLDIGMPIFGALAVFGIVYGAYCAYAQTDIKRMIAYSSISHLGFCVVALLAFNPEGLAGGTLHMINHGLATGALFLVVGMMADRYGSQPMSQYSGLWNKLPLLTFFMIVLSLASVGLPGLNNFVSEMLMLGSLFDVRNTQVTTLAFAVFAGFGIFLSAWYMLTMVQRVFFGPLREPDRTIVVTDLTTREVIAVGIPTLFCLLLGLFPQPALNIMKSDVTALSKVADEARERQVSRATNTPRN